MALITSLSPLYLRRPRRRKLPITAWLTVGCPGNRTRLSVMRVRRLDHYTKRHPAVAAYGQGHHHNGDQVARPPNMMRSICGRRYATSWFVIRGGHGWAHLVAGPWVPISSPLAHMVYLVTFLSYLVGSKGVLAHPSARPSDPDTITNTALEATASSSGKNVKSETQLPLPPPRIRSTVHQMNSLIIAICFRPETAVHAISGHDMKTIKIIPRGNVLS